MLKYKISTLVLLINHIRHNRATWRIIVIKLWNYSTDIQIQHKLYTRFERVHLKMALYHFPYRFGRREEIVQMGPFEMKASYLFIAFILPSSCFDLLRTGLSS